MYVSHSGVLSYLNVSLQSAARSHFLSSSREPRMGIIPPSPRPDDTLATHTQKYVLGTQERYRA
jgi:hypothetical protein